MMTELQAGETGTVDSCAQTVRVRVLSESTCQQRASSQAPARSFDPYNTGIGVQAIGRKPRKSLDDMRRLSEAIIRNRLRSKGAA